MKAGFVAVLGAPNAGKSTFVNQAVGTKVSIVSPKVQTTRTRVLGIAIVNDAAATNGIEAEVDNRGQGAAMDTKVIASPTIS